MTERFRLIATADVARLGPCHYLFDRAAQAAGVVSVPTQRISEHMASVVRTLRDAEPPGKARSRAELESLFERDADRRRVGSLLAAGYLEPVDDAHDAQGTLRSHRVLPIDAQRAHFRQGVLKHYLRKLRFFNLPAEIDNATVDVGLVGLPISSVPQSAGTTFGPDRLRQYSQSAGFWFDFAERGVYCELGCDGTAPSLLCEGLVLKDFGNLGADARTVGDLFGEVRRFLETEVLPNRIRPVFVGGDHAITFAVVDAVLKHAPKLALLHLDAHNDLYYTRQVEFNHAGPIHALLLESGLPSVHAFGLRTQADDRVDTFRQFRTGEGEQAPLASRVRMHSIGATRRRLADPDAFAAYLKESVGEDTPCYLSVDLDVLSAGQVGRQLSTPAGHGLAFHELYEFVHVATGALNVVAADLVEFNVAGDSDDANARRDVVTLLIHLVHGLHRAAARHAVGLGIDRGPKTAAGASRAAAADRDTQPGTQRANARTPAGSDANGAATGPTRRVPALLRPVAESPALDVQPIARRGAGELSYEAFLHEHLMPGRPLVLSGHDAGPCLTRWRLDYFRQAVESSRMMNVKVFGRPFDHGRATLCGAPAGDMLRLLEARAALGLDEADERYYVTDWCYGHAAPDLNDDVIVPPWFSMDVSERVTGDRHALKWIYIGEPGTASPTHVDVLNTCAWLLLVSGRKAWRMVHRDDAPRVRTRHGWMDLFDPASAAGTEADGAVVWETEQRPGEIVWTPSCCVHAVRNLEFSVAITQNYADLTNLADVQRGLLDRIHWTRDEAPPAVPFAELLGDCLHALRRAGHGAQEAALLSRYREQIEKPRNALARLAAGLDASLRAEGSSRGAADVAPATLAAEWPPGTASG